MKQNIASQSLFLVLSVFGTAPLVACAYSIPVEESVPPPGNYEPPSSSTVVPPPPTESPVDVPRQAPRVQHNAALTNPPPAVPTAVTPQLPQLIGLEPAAVAEQLGQATAVETNALSLVWTYEKVDCTLKLFFYPDIENLAFHVLKYRVVDPAGEAMADESACTQTFAEGVR